MSVSDVEAVIEFFRKNGLSESESALQQDIIQKGDLGSLDYEKFFFPMVPPPPLLRIPSSSRLPPNGDCPKPSFLSSDDEFVSLGSSTSDVCSSEFINPYGIRSTSQGGSEASSDRLSQFGTARDYPDFDLQNDLWCNDKEDGYFMTPNFEGPDFFGCQSEDKFIMLSEIEKLPDNPLSLVCKFDGFEVEGNSNSLDKDSLFNLPSMEDENTAFAKNHYDADKIYQPDTGFGGKEEDSDGAHSCSPLLCKCCAGKGSQGGILVSGSYPHLKEINLNEFQSNITGSVPKSFDSAPVNIMNQNFDYSSKNYLSVEYKDLSNSPVKVKEMDLTPYGAENYEHRDDGVQTGVYQELKAALDKEDAANDELLMYSATEDEYETFNLRIIHRKNRTGFEENKDFPIVLNAVIAGRYYITEYLGSAAFSKVVQAHDIQTGIDVCLKIIKNDKDFFDQSLDEIKLLKIVNKNDPYDRWHILRLYDYFYHQEHLFIVCELLRANLYEFQKFNQESGGEAYFTMNRLQVIARQCLEALDYLHSLGIIHCDLKPENILIKNYRRCEIKVIDLGSSCFLTDNLCLYVQSRSYRAPEVILGLPYDQKIDIWSLGCILAELCTGEVLFPNNVVITILARMIGILGPVDLEMLLRGQDTHKYFTKEYDLYYVNEETDEVEYIIPEASSLEQHLPVKDKGFIDFLKYLLRINPKRRPTAKQALNHAWLSHVYNLKTK